MVRHPGSGAVLPRLTSFPDPAVRDGVNRQLDSLAASLRCEEEDRGHEYESAAAVTHAADDVLSVHVRASYYCGGAYPVNGANVSVTYDLRTGEPVPFAALFADFERDGAEIVRAVFPEHVPRAERLRAAGREPEAGSGEECDPLYAVESLLGTGLSYTLSERGLTVEPDFAHVARACAEEVLVPFGRIRSFAAPGGVLARVADTRRQRPDPERSHNQEGPP
jgi:hypothetical protein